jgi:uncharacterized protein YutE (UPF0331/DUF86 family)
MNEKQSKLEMLHAKINVLDALVQTLMHICAENKVKLPKHVIEIVEALYNKKLVKENGKEKSGEAN